MAVAGALLEEQLAVAEQGGQRLQPATSGLITPVMMTRGSKDKTVSKERVERWGWVICGMERRLLCGCVVSGVGEHCQNGG